MSPMTVIVTINQPMVPYHVSAQATRPQSARRPSGMPRNVITPTPRPPMVTKPTLAKRAANTAHNANLLVLSILSVSFAIASASSCRSALTFSSSFVSRAHSFSNRETAALTVPSMSAWTRLKDSLTSGLSSELRLVVSCLVKPRDTLVALSSLSHTGCFETSRVARYITARSPSVF